MVDIIVNVPGEVLKFIRPDQAARVESGGQEIQGKVFAVIPKGNIATRTFPLKIRVQNNRLLLEGMEAVVTLSTGRNRKSLAVPRDALLTVSGRPVVFVVRDSKAAAGGFIGLQLVNLLIASQLFDILTMLGFIILIGVVSTMLS